MMKYLVSACCIWVLTLQASLAADGRYALILANSEYEFTTPLRNPVNDANAVRERLEALGFEVHSHFDLGYRAMQRAIDGFSDVAQNADTVVIFYAGHAVSLDGRNYIVSTDAAITSAQTIKEEHRLERLLGAGKSARNVIAFIDACRDTPLGLGDDDVATTRSTGSVGISRGLARLSKIDGPANQNRYTVMAAQPGQVAFDGDARNSPFTTALLEHLDAQVTVEQLSKRIMTSVRNATQGKQVPSVMEATMFSDVCLPGSCTQQNDISKEADRSLALLGGAPNVDQLTAFIGLYGGTDASRKAEVMLEKLLAAPSENTNGNQARANRLQARAEAAFFTGINYPKVLEMFIEAGDAGSPFGYIKAAHMLDQGIGIPSDAERAQILAKAVLGAVDESVRTNPKGAYYASLTHNYGLGRPVDKERAFELALMGAEGGEPLAQNAVAINFTRGEGAEKNFKEAEKWYEKALDQGLARAGTNLGDLYRDSTKDYDKAMVAYEKAETMGLAIASAKIGYMYDMGFGVKKDPAKAIEYYETAGRENVPFALNNLGVVYDTARGVEKDYKKAMEYYVRATKADANFALPLENIGRLYRQGLGVPVNREKATEFYEKAAALGLVKGLFFVGEMHRKGEGGPVNMDKARILYERLKEADPKNAKASLGIGHVYAYSDTEFDAAKSIAAYETAGKLGDSYGYLRASRMVRDHVQTTPKEYKRAMTYAKQAAEAGNSYGYVDTGWLYKKAGEYQNAIAEFEKAIKGDRKDGKRDGNYELAKVFRYDLGSESDVRKSIKYFSEAVEHGSSSAAFELGWIKEFYDPKDPAGAAKSYMKSLEMGSRRLLQNDNKPWNRTTARELQKLLKQSGHYTGAIDGQFGSGSWKAVERACGCTA